MKDPKPTLDNVPAIRAQLGISDEHIKNPPTPPAIQFIRERHCPETPPVNTTVVHVSPFQDVRDFHMKYGIQYDGAPRRKLPDNLNFFRIKRLQEEMKEYIDATTPEDELDALIDLIYIAIGTIDSHGWDGATAWARVHAANMAKARVSKENPSRFGVMYDVVKPKGWVAPNHSDLVGE